MLFAILSLVSFTLWLEVSPCILKLTVFFLSFTSLIFSFISFSLSLIAPNTSSRRLFFLLELMCSYTILFLIGDISFLVSLKSIETFRFSSWGLNTLMKPISSSMSLFLSRGSLNLMNCLSVKVSLSSLIFLKTVLQNVKAAGWMRLLMLSSVMVPRLNRSSDL